MVNAKLREKLAGVHAGVSDLHAGIMLGRKSVWRSEDEVSIGLTWQTDSSFISSDND